ncbi:MAG: AlpA family transcriptional regulator [Beijerinckiaceae bacterium]|nr:AlpA family transcriptional regulator [Beijerinckiaceae bacterium]
MGANSEQSVKRSIRRNELRQIVPLADTTIYEMEQRGEFPRRFALTTRCVVWDLAEVEAWLAERRRATENAATRRSPHPDVRQRRIRPVKARGQEPASASTVE